MPELSTKARWGASYKVDSAGWTADDKKGDTLIDAALGRFLIVGNSVDTLYLELVTKPVAGAKATFGTPGWTANQYMNNKSLGGGVTLQSVLQDAHGKLFPILQNTTDSLIIGDFADNPTLPTGYIVQGGRRVATLAAPTAAVGGYWQIVDPDGTAVDNSDSNPGGVTVTDGGTALPVDQKTACQALDGRGLLTLSFIVGFFEGDATSPKGVLALQVNNTPGKVSSGGQIPGPDPLDPGWVGVKFSADGAAIATSLLIDNTTPRVIVPSIHPDSPLAFARWWRLTWTPDAMGAGSGSLVAYVYGYGFASV